MEKVLRFSSIERSSFLLPAITIIASFSVWMFTRNSRIVNITSLNELSSIKNTTIAIVLLFMIALTFIIAHVIDTVSYTIYGRILSDKINGFPHTKIVPGVKRQLKMKFIDKNGPIIYFSLSRHINYGIKIMIMCVFLFSIISIIIRHPYFNQENLLLRKLAFNILYIVKISIEVYFIIISLLLAVASHLYSRKKFRNRIGNSKKVWVMLAIKVLNFIYIQVKIYNFFNFSIQKIFRLDTRIDEATFNKIKSNLLLYTGIKFEDLRTNDRFWLPFLIVLDHSRQASIEVKDLEKKTTFCRNQALSLFVASLILSSSYTLDQNDIIGFLNHAEMIYLSLICFFSSQFFCFRFYQNYYSFTRLTFRIFSSLPTLNGTKRKKSTKLEAATTN
jgi:hypothetical protein